MKTEMNDTGVGRVECQANGTGAMSAQDQEELCSQVVESFPNMIFLKYGEPEIRDDYDKGFR
jgi:hypothetical protein